MADATPTPVPNVLFITGNGHGLGHLTRMMAVARHANGRFHPVFLTLSQAFPLATELGWVVEYLPSYTKLNLTRVQWEPIFASRLVGSLKHIKPRVVIVDHISPPVSLARVRTQCQGIDFVWSRRGMWREGRNMGALRMSDKFDLVVEPRDVAGPIDVGLTTAEHRGVTFVGPVVLVPPAEQGGRDEARRALGIPLDGRAVLIQLSDSNSEQWAEITAQVRDVVLSVVGQEKVHLFTPLHALHGHSAPVVDGVIMRPVYPIALYLKAFDGIVSTAGYNSFHEVVASGVPAVFIARTTDSLDDQARRAAFVELCGRGFCAPTISHPAFRKAIRRMLLSDEGSIAATVTRELGTFEGAAEFADLVAERCVLRSNEEFAFTNGPGTNPPNARVLDRIISGDQSSSGEGSAQRMVIVALGFSGIPLAKAVSHVDSMQKATPMKPIFLVNEVDGRDAALLDRQGFQYETVMDQSVFSDLAHGSYDQYLNDVIDGMRFRYGPTRVVTLSSDEAVGRQLPLAAKAQD